MSQGDQTEVADVLQVSGGERALVVAAQQRLDHALDPILLQLVGELVKVRLAAHDELLLGVEDVVGGNRPRAVTAGFGAEAGFCAKRVGQPWLAPGLSPHGIQRLGSEHLPRLLGVLGEQRAHLSLREVAEAQGSGLDVERAATGDHGVLRGGLDPIVADVAHPAQHHAVRGSSRADGGLARLPGRVQHEVPHVPDQVQDLAEIEPFQRRDAVMALRYDRAFGVELAHVSPEVCRMC